MRRTIAAMLLAASAAASGCANASRPTAPDGAAMFASECSSCHSLIGNESKHTPGGDLLGYSYSRSFLIELVSQMPTPRPLSAAQLRAVVNYVLRAQAHSAHRA
jgi:mono/diheme cytochrome c family protein